jgi:hypothetical protein
MELKFRMCKMHEISPLAEWQSAYLLTIRYYTTLKQALDQTSSLQQYDTNELDGEEQYTYHSSRCLPGEAEFEKH